MDLMMPKLLLIVKILIRRGNDFPYLDPLRVPIGILQTVLSFDGIVLLHSSSVPGFIDWPKHTHFLSDHAIVAEAGSR